MSNEAYSLFICPTCGSENETRKTVKKKIEVSRLNRDRDNKWSFVEHRFICQCDLCEMMSSHLVSSEYFEKEHND